MPADTINIRQTAAITQSYIISEQIRLDGYLSGGYVHFPAGCNGLVLVRIRVEKAGAFKAVCPVDDYERSQPQYVALDDFTLPFPIDLEAKKGDRVEVEIRNTDFVNAHTISVLVNWWDTKAEALATIISRLFPELMPGRKT